MLEKRWVFLSEKQNNLDLQILSEKLRIPKILASVLLSRGLDAAGAEHFFSRSKRDIHNPFLLLGMEKAVKRIQSALEKREKIVVYGDYDVDGITSTAMLCDFLQSLGANVEYYIPNRADEGYGINIIALSKIRKGGANLLITVDCGITAVGEVEFAKSIGLDIVVTDHHMCKEKIPRAAAVVNPKQPDCTYPYKELAGVGVCFKLVLAMAMQLGKKAGEYFDRYVDLCAVGTIADVVPLTGENRIMVHAGLKALAKTSRPGLAALSSIAGIAEKTPSVTNVSFALAPRINAAGRVGNVEMGVRLLLETDPQKAYEAARYLDEENNERRMMEKKILDDVAEMIEADPNFEKQEVLLFAKEGWHHGVIGIVASRLVDRYYKPSILISIEKGMGKGSGRSIDGLNLFDALSDSAELLTKFGGHEKAAGLSVAEEHIPELRRRLCTYVREHLSPADAQPTLLIDAAISLSDATVRAVEYLGGYLEPYGTGNPKPVFALLGCEIVEIRPMGEEDRHLRLRLKNRDKYLVCVGFGMGDQAAAYQVGSRVDAALHLELNEFRGEISVQGILCDLRKSVS